MAALPDGVYTRPGSNIYWLRIGIPKDLRDTFPLNKSGKPPVDAYRRSLGTSDRNTARSLARQLIAEWDAEFTRRRLAKLAATNPPTQPMSEALADHLAALASWEILAFDDMSRLNLPELVPPLQFFSDQPPPNSTLLHRHAQGSDAIAREMLLNAAAGSFEEALEFAQRSCRQLGISIDWQAGLTTLSLMRIQRALAAAWMQAGARSRGDLIETPWKPTFAPGGAAAPQLNPSQSPVAPVAPAASGKTLTDVIPMWEDKTSAKPPVAQAMRRAVRYYIEATGSEALASLTAATAVVQHNQSNRAIEAQAEQSNQNVSASYRVAQEQSRSADAQAFQQRTDRASQAARQIALARVNAAEGRGSLASMAVNITGAEADDLSRINVNNANQHSNSQQQIAALSQQGLSTAASLNQQASAANTAFFTTIGEGAVRAGSTYYSNAKQEKGAEKTV